MHTQALRTYAPVVLRFAMCLVFLYFGTSQLSQPSIWTSVVPDWATSMSGMSANTIVHINGWFEIIASLLLLVGVYARWVALLLALHLFGIAASLGINPLGVRDFGLSFATLAVAMYGEDALTVMKTEKQ